VVNSYVEDHRFSAQDAGKMSDQLMMPTIEADYDIYLFSQAKKGVLIAIMGKSK
jgi:hypothetical protein